MNDPYDALGVSPAATDAQIKKAYKNLAKKAASLPADEAKKRMDALNRAYDAVMNRRMNATGYTESGYTTGSGANGYRSAYPYTADSTPRSDYYDVRELIDNGRIDDANMILDGVPSPARNAEWHFLKGKVMYQKGRLEDASREFEAAYRLEPANAEYRSVYEDIYRKRSGGYRRASESRGCSPCNVCSGLICADCCCESLGGDLITCC